jgi:hypothetical protein
MPNGCLSAQISKKIKYGFKSNGRQETPLQGKKGPWMIFLQLFVVVEKVAARIMADFVYLFLLIDR